MLTYSRVLCSAKPIGVNAQASKAVFCLPQRATQVLRGPTRSWTPVQCINADLQQSVVQCKTHRCNVQTSKAAFCLPQRATQVLRGPTRSWTPVQCINADLQQSVMQCKPHRCECTDKQGCFMLASESNTIAERTYRVLDTSAVHQC